MEGLRVVAIASSEETRTTLQNQLDALDFVQYTGVHLELGDAVRVCQDTSPDVIVIELTDRELDGGLFIQAINMNIENPSAIIALHQELDPRVMIEAVRQGAKEFFQYPQEQDKLASALKKHYAILYRAVASAQAPIEDVSGKIISVFSSKGGSGTSTLSVNLAHELYQMSKSPVVLFDLDQLFNNTAVMLNLKPNYSLGDLAQNTVEEIDEDLLKRIVVEHDSGLHVVVGSKSALDENEMIFIPLLERVLEFLTKHYRYVVIDLPNRVLDPYHEYLVEHSDQFLLLSCLDVPSLYRTRQYLDLAKQYMGEQKLKLVLNRWNLKAAYGMSNKSLEEEFHYPVFARLANDWELNVEANSIGAILSKVNPNADLVKGIQKLASQLTGTETEAGTSKEAAGGGLLGKLFNTGRDKTSKDNRGNQRNAISQTELGV